MKNVFFALALIASITLQAQSFYDLNTVQKIEITFAQSNWDQLLDNEKASTENYIMAQSVTINGQVFDSVGVKYKGNSTYRANQTKNPFHIELDTYKDHIYETYTDIKLSNVANDPSFVREVLSYQILRQYMDAPLSNYANVYVNGTLIGLYSNSEAVSKKFVKSRFGSKKNTFVKCNPPAGAGPGSSDFPNLVYLGTDSSKYYASYELKSDAGWDELIHLCDTLSNSLNSIEEILDVDRALWMLAFNNVFVNLDSYSGGFAQNYYLYRNSYDRFLPVVWDLNESFGRFSMTGSGNLNSTASKQTMSHLLHENDANYPLIKQLLSVPIYKRMYLAHIKTMLQENFADKSYITTGESLQTTIDSDVQADGNKFFTYNDFKSNLNSDIRSGGGPGGGTTPGISNLMNTRSSYLLGLSDFTNTQPTISNVTLSDSTPALNSNLTITATIKDENTAYIGIRNGKEESFKRELMYDDGLHNDGASNDGVYGVILKLSNLNYQFYIYAENANIGMFSPQRAEYEYHNVTITSDLVINELCASNDKVYRDKTGEYEDWIELYNNGDKSIALGDYYLSDDIDDSTKWKLPSEDIQPGEYKILWASNDTARGSDHANFKLSRTGEELGLYRSNAGKVEPVDFISYSSQSTNYSYGRKSDAASEWIIFKIPTPNKTNVIINVNTGTEESILVPQSLGDFNLYPNPYRSEVFFENNNDEIISVIIFTSNGALLDEFDVQPNQTIIWKDEFTKGVRIVKLKSESYNETRRLISQ